MAKCDGDRHQNPNQLRFFENDADDDGSVGNPKSSCDTAVKTEMRITDDELKERYQFWKRYDVIVNRSKVATALGLSPNRVSELVGIGVLQYVSRKPLLFALEHCKGCYRDYQWWITVRKPRENYVDPEHREAEDFDREE